MKGVMAFVGIVLLCAWGAVRTYSVIVFDQQCEGFLKRASDANTVEMARAELEQAIAYAERHDLTSGYTSVLYRTPDEDVGFWYRNLVASRAELARVSESTTQLERTNVLMKLRETLLDSGAKGVAVTVPAGIS